MRVFVTLMFVMTLAAPTLAAEKRQCKNPKRYEAVSCNGIEGAKREHFCWKKKRKLSPEKKASICKRVKKKKSKKVALK